MGAGILWWMFNTNAKIRASSSWPTADGVVVHSAVAVDRSRNRGNGYRLSYRVDVRYRYQVSVEQYESSTFVFGVPRSYADRATAEAEVATYPIGRHVAVRYDPVEPKTSCLMPGETPEAFQLLGWMSGAFLLGGLISIVSGVLSMRNRKPKPSGVGS
jgi:hypothetical protein